MANKTKGIVKIDAEWSMRYTTNSMVEMEDELELPTPELMYMLEEGRLGFKTIRTMIWAGLIHQFDNEDGTYDLSLRSAGEVMDKFGFDVVVDKMTQALELQFPEESGEESGEEKPKANREQRREGAEAKNS